MAPTLAGPVMFVGTILVLVALAAAGDAPVFAAVAVVGVAVVLVVRRRGRRAR
jgi:uncharacterized protein (TIGR03382 family)